MTGILEGATTEDPWTQNIVPCQKKKEHIHIFLDNGSSILKQAVTDLYYFLLQDVNHDDLCEQFASLLADVQSKNANEHVMTGDIPY
jgi:hypothetical protein